MNKSASFLKPSFLRNGKQIITQRNFTRALFASSLSYLGKQTGVASNVNFSTSIFSKNLMFGDRNQTRGYASMSFEDAVQKSKSMKDPDNSTKLRVYGLYKQATVGKATGKRPGAMDFVGRAKFDAWSELGDMSQDEAKKQYIELVQSNLGDAGASSESSGSGQSGSSAGSGVEGLDITIENGIRTILKNRPAKFNALTREMYRGIAQTLTEANDDPNTNVIVITGAGNNYCSGNDLSNFTVAGDLLKMAKDGRDLLEQYIDSYIYCKKPIVAIINGPAIGISVTVLGLCDLVLSSDQATFSSPFSALGQSPEGCASYTFPRIMGYAKASELLFFNQKITAAEAEKLGLVTAVYPHDSLQVEAWKRVKEIAQLPVKSLVYSKELVRGRERDLLHQVNVAECDRLQERWVSEDCMNAIQKFFMRKSKV